MPVWVPLAAAFIGLCAGLSSVFLTRWFTSEQKHDERLEQLRQEQRDVLVDLIDVLDRWGPMTGAFAMVLAQDTQSKEAVKFFETDSGKEMLAASKEVRRVLVRCLLTVVDDQLRPLVLEIDTVVRSREDMHKEVLEAAKDDWVKGAGVGMRYGARIQRLSEQLQEHAAQRLSTPATPPGRVNRRRR